jgi:RNA recognition motif-containing protein
VNTLHVKNLPYATTNKELSDHFGRFGEIRRAVHCTDRETGKPRGFGFVEFAHESDARRALKEADGSTFAGRVIAVSEATPRPRRSE